MDGARGLSDPPQSREALGGGQAPFSSLRYSAAQESRLLRATLGAEISCQQLQEPKEKAPQNVRDACLPPVRVFCWANR